MEPNENPHTEIMKYLKGIDQKLETIKDEIVGLKYDVKSLAVKVKRIDERTGHLVEDSVRAVVEAERGTDWARRYEVFGIDGIVNLLSNKPDFKDRPPRDDHNIIMALNDQIMEIGEKICAPSDTCRRSRKHQQLFG